MLASSVSMTSLGKSRVCYRQAVVVPNALLSWVYRFFEWVERDSAAFELECVEVG